ncbi:MAG: hypothetical protein AB7E09_01035 [Candidatus Izemoplasmatales bacterium]
MNNNLISQIRLGKEEKVYYDFSKLKGKNTDCRIVLTTKRLIIYNDGIYYQNKRKIRKKGINEIQRNTITHIEYYIEYVKSHYISKMIGFILMIAAIVLAVFKYSNSTYLPLVSDLAIVISGNYVLVNDLFYYGIALIILIFALIMIFKTKRTLIFKVISGHMDDYAIHLKKKKYNEEAIRRIASKLYMP